MLSSIQNYYERLVMECIQEILGESENASDPDYVDDLACIALNRLPPRYVRHSVDLASHMSDGERSAMKADVTDAVDQAIEIMARRVKGRSA